MTGAKVTHAGGVRNKDELMDIQNLIPAVWILLLLVVHYMKIDFPAKSYGVWLNQEYSTKII